MKKYIRHNFHGLCLNNLICVLIMGISVFAACVQESVPVKFPDKAIVKIEIVDKPTKLIYTPGETFKPAGLTVWATYTDGSQEKIDTYALDGFSSDTIGEKTITVSYKGKTDSFTVTVINPVAAPTAHPPAGPVDTGMGISLKTTTLDAEIWYTTDESNPEKNGLTSKRYLEPVIFTQAMTIKAIGTKEGMTPSTVFSAAYIPAVPVSGISLAEASYTLYLGKVLELNAIISPENATNKSLRWTSSDETVVRVIADGNKKNIPNCRLLAAGEGTAYITGETEDGGKTAECTISVTGYNTLMVPVEPGTFIMGYGAGENSFFVGDYWGNGDGYAHEVTLTRGFSISKYPVTQAQYELVVGYLPDFKLYIYEAGTYFTLEKKSILGNPDATENHPMHDIAWYDAILFCNMLSILEGLDPVYSIKGSTNPADWPDVLDMDMAEYGNYKISPVKIDWDKALWIDGANGYRLPTDAEWEYACRAGTTTAFNNGTNHISSDEANFDASRYPFRGGPIGIRRETTTPVDAFPPNAWGLYDFHGNVKEWVWDEWTLFDGWEINKPNPEEWIFLDPKGLSGNGPYVEYEPLRVIRGGNFGEIGQYILSGARTRCGPNARAQLGDTIGFRVARSRE